MLSPDNFVQSLTYSQNYNRYSYVVNNPLKYTDPDGEFLTWSFGNGGFSIGFNLTPIGIPLGAGLNLGWSNGFSLGGYGELGYRVGGTGLGSGATVSQSLGYNFKYSTWSTTTSEGAYASFGLFNAGINFSQTYDITNNRWSYGWGVSAGVGMGNDRSGIGLYVGYGSGGWSYGLGGYYNPYAKPYYEANLEGYENIAQDDPLNCKNATLEAIEKLNGGSRTQADFKKMGDAFLKKNRNATLEEYFEHFGFDVRDPTTRLITKYQYGEAIKSGYPIVATENISTSLDHTMTIVKMRQWTSGSNMKVWFADPARGVWKANWNIFYSPSFQKGQGLFFFNLR